MRIDYPGQDQIPQLRQLWKEAFGDDDGFLDLFFGEVFSSDRCRCVTEEDQVSAMLYWFDCRCEDRPIAYLYAVATAKKRRGRGLCRALMENTHALLAELGYTGCLLVPGELGLFELYGSMGYGCCATVREFSCQAQGPRVRLRELTGEEYAAARREYLPRGGVVQEGENLVLLSKLGKFYQGPDFLLCTGGSGETLSGLELLGNDAAAPAILAALGKPAGTFRTPGEGREFTMYHPLKAGVFPTYFAFAFD